MGKWGRKSISRPNQSEVGRKMCKSSNRGGVLMAIIEKYYLYRPDGTEEIKVEKRKPNVNTVKTLTGAHFSEEYKEMTDSELKHFKGVYEFLYEEELGLQATIFDL